MTHSTSRQAKLDMSWNKAREFELQQEDRTPNLQLVMPRITTSRHPYDIISIVPARSQGSIDLVEVFLAGFLIGGIPLFYCMMVVAR